jgi:flagellar basal-body rod protein FlgG
MRALHTAATGMMAQELNVEVISNNIANMRTTGFKRMRAEFQDLLYQSMRRVGSTTSDSGTVVPAGIQIGSGVKSSGTPRVGTQGSLLPTERELDVAIRGEGYLRLTMPDGRTAYTRDGSLQLDPNGQLVTADGHVLDPNITVPTGSRGLTINALGVVQIIAPGQTTSQDIGTIQLSRFANKAGLESIGDNLFIETDASGSPQTGNPGADDMGTLLQGHLEQSNVNAVTEISDLIAAQRAYEMNSRVISAADQMLQSTSAMLR